MWDLRADHPEASEALAKRFRNFRTDRLGRAHRGAAQREGNIQRDGAWVRVLFPAQAAAGFLWFETDSPGVCAAGVCIGTALQAAGSRVAETCQRHDAGEINVFTCAISGTPMMIEVADSSAAVVSDRPHPASTFSRQQLVNAGLKVDALIWLTPHAAWSPIVTCEDCEQ
jgi:hypothetical protein